MQLFDKTPTTCLFTPALKINTEVRFPPQYVLPSHSSSELTHRHVIVCEVKQLNTSEQTLPSTDKVMKKGDFSFTDCEINFFFLYYFTNYGSVFARTFQYIFLKHQTELYRLEKFSPTETGHTGDHGPPF